MILARSLRDKPFKPFEAKDICIGTEWQLIDDGTWKDVGNLLCIAEKGGLIEINRGEGLGGCYDEDEGLPPIPHMVLRTTDDNPLEIIGLGNITGEDKELSRYEYWRKKIIIDKCVQAGKVVCEPVSDERISEVETQRANRIEEIKAEKAWQEKVSQPMPLREFNPGWCFNFKDRLWMVVENPWDVNCDSAIDMWAVCLESDDHDGLPYCVGYLEGFESDLEVEYVSSSPIQHVYQRGGEG